MDQEQTEYKKIIALEHFQKAYEHQMKGELEEAVDLYKKSIDIHPTAEAYTFLGWTYSFMGRYDAAIEECRRTLNSRIMDTAPPFHVHEEKFYGS